MSDKWKSNKHSILIFIKNRVKNHSHVIFYIKNIDIISYIFMRSERKLKKRWKITFISCSVNIWSILICYSFHIEKRYVFYQWMNFVKKKYIWILLYKHLRYTSISYKNNQLAAYTWTHLYSSFFHNLTRPKSKNTKYRKSNNPNPTIHANESIQIFARHKNRCLKCQTVECPKGRPDDDQRSSKNDNSVKRIE